MKDYLVKLRKSHHCKRFLPESWKSCEQRNRRANDSAKLEQGGGSWAGPLVLCPLPDRRRAAGKGRVIELCQEGRKIATFDSEQ